MKRDILTLYLFLSILYLIKPGCGWTAEKDGDRIYTGLNIVVVRAEQHLYVYDHDTIVKAYIISVGNSNTGKTTPGGKFTIVNKVNNPIMVWRSGKAIPPNDPRNSYGARWIGLARFSTGTYRGYGIQGTNVESSVGSTITMGSIHMYNKDIIELFDLVDLGTEVTIR